MPSFQQTLLLSGRGSGQGVVGWGKRRELGGFLKHASSLPSRDKESGEGHGDGLRRDAAVRTVHLSSQNCSYKVRIARTPELL